MRIVKFVYVHIWKIVYILNLYVVLYVAAIRNNVYELYLLRLMFLTYLTGRIWICIYMETTRKNVCMLNLHMDLCTTAICVNNVYIIHTWNQTCMKIHSKLCTVTYINRIWKNIYMLHICTYVLSHIYTNTCVLYK